jgi:2-polyprenyl-6-methoxyphenol hydroxylase-like FAD-dependent oxidoreductase
MPRCSAFDVIVVGGGIAGSTLGGMLARAGLGVLVVEKEPAFRDRVRGETTWPYGVADALAMGLEPVLAEAGVVEITGVRQYRDRKADDPYRWAEDSIDALPELGFDHPRLQEAAFQWAQAQGAETVRPAKAMGFSRGGTARVMVVQDGAVREYTARLVVGADGKHAMARRWTGGESVSDPEHHRFGGVLISGVRTADRDTDNVARIGLEAVNWFASGADNTRLYLQMTADRLREIGADRSFDAVVAFAREVMPEGALDEARQEGPIGFFANSCTWATQIAGNNAVLVGDAAGSPDPSQGHGTALLFHDVRTLSAWLLTEHDWEAAVTEYAKQRRAYFAAVLASDRWECLLSSEAGRADRLREGHQRAREQDPALGGFALIEARGPDGLVADEAARRHYFGEDLAETVAASFMATLPGCG